ncbi:hypothetical protein [Ruminococcus sp. 5_1_39BFAA]|uniref:hypothetical protein n=1 Tax=Ruminococcus sp. 5_1_39BFAA TaxID=457412 RepID=UPI003563E2DB
MEQEETVRLCEELELLFEHMEGHITLEEYHARMQQLQRERENILKDSGMLAE